MAHKAIGLHTFTPLLV